MTAGTICRSVRQFTMYSTHHVVFSCIFLFCLLSPSFSEDCVSSGPCTCSNSQGTIDLTPLAHADGTAAFPDNPDTMGSWFYSFNPCNQFSEGSGGCDNVAACQTDTMGSYFNLGTQDSAKFSLDSSQNLQLEYSATTDTQRNSFVALTCDPNTESAFTVTGENPPGSGNYYFVLTSKYCCPSSDPGPGPGPTITVSISVGSVLVIVFFALVFVYFVFGTVFQAFVRKASGREMIPNVSLWASLPMLIKDGMMFTFTCGRSSGYGKM